MARAAARLLFAALLALLAAQLAVPAVYLTAAPSAIAWCADTDRDLSEPHTLARPAAHPVTPESRYATSFYRQPASHNRFQRPPPAKSLFP